MYLKQYFLEGLGCLSYLVGDEETGEAVVVDPQITVDEYVRDADMAGLSIRHVLETHLHADHLSGNRALAKATGATVHLPSAAKAAFPHERLADGDELRIGHVVLRARATPGHTPEHLAYEVVDLSKGTEQPYALLTGDTLFVGSAGRPDLVGTAPPEELAQQLFHTLTDVLPRYGDSTLVYPGHGPGSACGAHMGLLLASSLGYERKTNPFLDVPERDRFVERVTSDLPPKPGNAVRLKHLNHDGPPEDPVRPDAVPALDPDAFHAAVGNGRDVLVLDVREPDAFAANHVPGSINVPLAPAQFPNRAAHYLEAGKPVHLVLEHDGDLRNALAGLARVGGLDARSRLAGGIQAWRNAGKHFETLTTFGPRDLAKALASGGPGSAVNARVLDVRTHDEWTSGHVEGALWVPWEELDDRLDELDPSACWVCACGSGYRSSMAASVLAREGFRGVGNLLGGMTAWTAAGQRVVTGEPRAEPPAAGTTGNW